MSGNTGFQMRNVGSGTIIAENNFWDENGDTIGSNPPVADDGDFLRETGEDYVGSITATTGLVIDPNP
jgi:hypothetical protein